MAPFDPYHIWLGISETARPVSKYRLLALVDFENNREVIIAAAERQTIYLRTLQAGEHAVLVADLLNEVSQARVTLLNADQKAEYDEGLRKQQTPEPEEEPVPEQDPLAFAAEELAAISSRPTTRSRGGKPFWHQPWSAAAGGAFVMLLIMLLFGSGDEPKESGHQKEMGTPNSTSTNGGVEGGEAGKIASGELPVQLKSVSLGIVKGMPREIRYAGVDWKTIDNAHVGQGVGNELFSRKILGRGDFRVQVKLKIDTQKQKDATAAGIGIRTNKGDMFLLLDGVNERIFMEYGPKFGGDIISLGPSTSTRNQSVDIEIRRNSNKLSFLVNKKQVYECDFDQNLLVATFLRPQRASMQVN